MNIDDVIEASPVTKVARDLTEILALHDQLLTQAFHDANATVDHSHLPGGRAMVELGNVANVEAWTNQQEATERYGRAYTSAEDEDPDESWPAFQMLEFWSEQWRAEHGAEYGTRPTIQSEANFLRFQLNWAWEHEPHFDEFAKDIETARTRLENILYAGERAERGVPCMYEECGGKRLTRKHVPARGPDGSKTWKMTNWHCPRCHREWDEDRYQSSIAAAAWAAQSEDVDGQTWCSVKYAARQVERSEHTVRSWLQRGHLSVACFIKGRRLGFVLLDEVRKRDEETRRRRRAA